MLKCKICGETASPMYRCDKHMQCDVCGTRKGLVIRMGGVTCDPCHAEIAKRQVEAFDGDTDCTDEITCPWCGRENSDSWEAQDEDEHVCDNCGNEYRHQRDILVSYSTEKI